MSFGENFAADFSVLQEACTFEVRGFNAGLVVTQLAHQVRQAIDCGPSQEGIELNQHASHAFDYALAMMPGRNVLRDKRRIGRGQLLFQLQEHGVFDSASKHQDNVVARTYASSSYDT